MSKATMPLRVDLIERDYANDYAIVSADGLRVADTLGCDFSDAENKAHVERMTACTNACEGVTNPKSFAELLVQVKVLLDDLEFSNTNGLHHLCWSGIMANAGNIKEHIDSLGAIG